MKLATLFAILSVISGLVAAWYWYQSTKPIVPPVLDENNVMRAMKWFTGVKEAADKTASANKRPPFGLPRRCSWALFRPSWRPQDQIRTRPIFPGRSGYSLSSLSLPIRLPSAIKTNA
jgi:hypothetical protein